MRYKIQKVSATFGSTAMNVRKIPAGKGVSSDPVDVTILTDEEEHFLPGALVKNKEFQLVVNGITEAPDINTVDDLEITVTYNNGTTDTEKVVEIENCILKDVAPPEAEAGGNRAGDWTLTFQPGGASDAANTGS